MNFERTWNILSELYSLEAKHKDFNIKAFENGTFNCLFVTGLSGSGKSMLAQKLLKKYKCEYVELDCLNLVNFFSSADLYKLCIIYKNFFKKYPGYEKTFNKYGLIAERLAVQLENDLITADEFDATDKRLTEFRDRLMRAFLKYLMGENKIKCIVDGVDIGYSQELFTGAEPLIILTASMNKASEQAYERDVIPPTKKQFKTEYKNDYKELEKNLEKLIAQFEKTKD